MRFPSLRRRNEDPVASGLNSDYYDPSVNFGPPVPGMPPMPDSAEIPRRHKSDKHRSRRMSPGFESEDDFPPRRSRGGRRDITPPGYVKSSKHRPRSPPPYYAPEPPAPRDSRRDHRSARHDRDRDYRPRDHSYPADEYGRGGHGRRRRSPSYSPEPRPRRHRSSHRDPYRDSQPEYVGKGPRRHSPEPRQRSRGFPQPEYEEPDDEPKPRSSRRHRQVSPSPPPRTRSRGGPRPGYGSDDEDRRQRRHRRHRSQPRDEPRDRGAPQESTRDLDKSRGHRSRTRSRGASTKDRAPLKRSSTLPNPFKESPAAALAAKAKRDQWWKHPMVQATARTALTAGAQAAIRHRGAEGDWLGSKGARVASAAFSAALTDGALGGGKKK